MAGTQEYNDLETQIFELRRQRFQAEQRLEIERQNVVARTAQLRIETATRARSVEVQNFQSAAAAGESYAEALRSLDSITQRQSFDALVIRLQDQGQSFEDALTEAQQYIEVIGAISPTVSRADIEHGRFNGDAWQNPHYFRWAYRSTNSVFRGDWCYVDACEGISESRRRSEYAS